MFPDSDAGSVDEWIDIADTQSDTNTEHVTNDINNAGDNSESEAEGYETDSEHNDIHSESRALHRKTVPLRAVNQTVIFTTLMFVRSQNLLRTGKEA